MPKDRVTLVFGPMKSPRFAHKRMHCFRMGKMTLSRAVTVYERDAAVCTLVM